MAPASPGKLEVTIQNHRVGAPTMANRQGVRIDPGTGTLAPARRSRRAHQASSR